MGEGKIVRVVIDTNVLVSALLFGGSPSRLVPLWKSRKILPYACREILDEYIRVLAYPRFKLKENELDYLLYKEILPYFGVVSIETESPSICNDPDDDKFLHCGLAAGVDAIVSGDKHLLSIGNYQGIPIVSVAGFFRISQKAAKLD
jgi:putative PIN family toxin of toxin-antitoxin system